MNETEMITELKRFAGFSEVYHKSCFEAYRNTKKGTVQKVSVEILDAGPEVAERYFCSATSGDGKTAAGNPAPTINEVLTFVHWQDLDL